MEVNLQTQGEKLRNTMIVYMVVILTCVGIGYDLYSKIHRDPTVDSTLTNYQAILYKGADYTTQDKELHNLPDRDGFSYFKYLQKGFNDHTFSLTNVAEANTIQKHTNFKGELDEVTNTFTTKDIIVTTDYKRINKNIHTLGGPQANVKQTFTLTNTTDKEKVTTFTSRTEIPANTIEYDGQTYIITEDRQYFKSEEKTSSIPEFAQKIGMEHPEEVENFKNYTHTYQTGSKMLFESKNEEGNKALAIYDWGDAKHLNHEVTIYSEVVDNGNKMGLTQFETRYYIEFVVKDIIIAPYETFIIDPSYGFEDSANYDTRYDGDDVIIPTLSENHTMKVGDVNGDTYGDLVIGSEAATYGGALSGSVFVIFGTSTTATGTKVLTTSTSYNIRYDGALDDSLSMDGAIAIGDVNGDGKGDLVIGAGSADNDAGNTGSAYVIFSDLIDDVSFASTTINPLVTPGNYNIRYDGEKSNDFLTREGSIAIGDVNGDNYGDLVLGGYQADNNGSQSGSAWVMFSDLINDVATTTTGQNKSLLTSTNYNIRYDGGAGTDNLTRGHGINIGDINGDSYGDLLLGSYAAGNNGLGSGSVWVMFSDLINDTATTTTGDNKLLSTATNYNIRYDGGAADDALGEDGNLVIGDLNGDSYGDLVLGSGVAGNNGALSGSAWVIFSDLINDVATTTTGQIKTLNTSTSYNIRYDGGTAGDNLTGYGAISIGDVNRDTYGDLAIGAWGAGYSVAGSGSVYIMLSDLINDVATTTTGQNKVLSTITNYNIRYDGEVSGDAITELGALTIGDVNGDTFEDLVFGGYQADFGGGSSGSVYVILSTQLDTFSAASTTINPLLTSSNYSMRYDGGAAGDNLSRSGSLCTGDVNGDTAGDLIIGGFGADNNGSDSGSVWIVLATTTPPVEEPDPEPDPEVLYDVSIQGQASISGSWSIN